MLMTMIMMEITIKIVVIITDNEKLTVKIIVKITTRMVVKMIKVINDKKT